MNTEVEELQELRELSAELTGSAQSEWEPECVSLAFSSEPRIFIFTLQVWMDLSRVRSPLLVGKLPATLREVDQALAAFGFPLVEDLTPDDAFIHAGSMLEEINAAWGMILPMKPEGSGTVPEGFGACLPLLASLMSELNMSMDAALACQVGRVFAVLSALRCNQGWSLAGVPYGLRHVLQGPNSQG